jgi:hypothetical protein
MAKLAVKCLDRLEDVSGTRFYRIIGRIVSYDGESGLLKIASIYDGSSCNVHLSFESEDTKWTKLPTVEEGSVVRIQAVSFVIGAKCALKCEAIDAISLPRHLLESEEIILSYSSLQ